MYAADTHDAIRVQGARVNNLRDVSVVVPKRRLTVFTGVSGSGKSSLVFGTIAAESQRLVNETYTAFVQGFMPRMSRPNVDVLENLTAAIIVDQERMGANARSTVGTVTDAYALLRLLFSRLSVPQVGGAGAFSFNLPEGMCPECQGLGKISAIDERKVVDQRKSLNEGAILAPGIGVGTWYWKSYAESGRVDPTIPLAELPPEQWDFLMYATGEKVNVSGMNMSYEGVIPRIRKMFIDKEKESRQATVRAFVSSIATVSGCPACHGTRLCEDARLATVNGATIAECGSIQVSDLLTWLDALHAPSVRPVISSLREMLEAFCEIGLGYISLNRESGSLSGGEAQRVKMIRHLGSSLSDITYVFDEPTVGLHPHDIQRMNRLLLQLRDKGNTVLVVEHKPDVMAIADHLIDMGPGAGPHGGTVTFSGDLAGLLASDTLTARYYAHRTGLRERIRQPTGRIPIRDAHENNLQHVDVDIPTGVLVCVTGVAGSGKSSLVHGSLVGQDGVVLVDQSAIRGSRRSNPATFTGLLDPVRTAFAKANGVKPALFSANSEGACPECGGLGVVYMDLGTMAGVASTCEVCGGRRFRDEVLQYRYDGLSIDQVFNLSVEDAARHFTKGQPKKIIARLQDVGLGYLTLGQPLTSLSGGERQRLKLAARMGEGGITTWVLDEPTSGLHMADTEALIGMLHRLVEGGTGVIVIEHNCAVMAQADWIIDLGPDAGHDGGRVVFEGTPQQMITSSETHTARYLRAWVQGT